MCRAPQLQTAVTLATPSSSVSGPLQHLALTRLSGYP